MILIKLGGSVITRKDVEYTFRKNLTERLIDEIDKGLDGGEELILVHGGGSFGHPGAERYRLNSDSPEKIAKATSEVQYHMRVLNNRILGAMIDRDMYPVSIPGGVITEFEDGRLNSIDKDLILKYLELGNVPLTFGDVTLDSERGVTICSGDDLMHALSDIADLAVFVTDIDGIFKNGSMVEEFTPELFPLTEKDLPNEELKEEGIDVTGSMNRKAEKMLDMSKNCRTVVINGEKSGRVEKMLNDKDTIFTEVRP